MKILFATAELRPLVSAGGLGEAAFGLVDGLRRMGHQVDVVLPDYSHWELDNEQTLAVDVANWAGPVTVRRGTRTDAGDLILVDGPGIERPDPYVDSDGVGWVDNDRRFASFALAVARLIEQSDYDVVQLNDWHTALVPAFTTSAVPTVLTIHNLAHQGWADIGWLQRLTTHHDNYVHNGSLNPLAGAIRSVDAVVAVSPNYATEILSEADGMALHEVLRARGQDLHGIRNGIDTSTWDPATDQFLNARFDANDVRGKGQSRAALLDRVGWDEHRIPTIVMVTRLVEQKGVDLAFESARYLAGMRARLIVLGSGDRALADWGRWLAAEQPERVHFIDGYDVALSHLLVAGGDVFLMPSRFEPCGLAQMQAMAYGTLPVVTAVGGLVDTVVDADDDRDGTGFVTRSNDVAGVVDGLHRALNSWRHPGRRKRIMRKGMSIDWSWDTPAAEFARLYEGLMR